MAIKKRKAAQRYSQGPYHPPLPLPLRRPLYDPSEGLNTTGSRQPQNESEDGIGGQGLLPRRFVERPGRLSDAFESLETQYLTEGNSAELREALQNALETSLEAESPPPGVSLLLAHWLARYALMAGDVETAYDAYLLFPLAPGMRVLRAMLDPSQTRWGHNGSGAGEAAENFIGIWESFPCNYYTYRYTLFSDELLTTLSASLASSPALLARSNLSARRAASDAGNSLRQTVSMASSTPESAQLQSLIPLDAYPVNYPPPVAEPDGRAPEALEEVDPTLPAKSAVDCFQYWNWSIRDYYHDKPTSAGAYLEKALWSILEYFALRYDSEYGSTVTELGAPTSTLEAYDFLAELAPAILDTVVDGSTDYDLKAYMRERFRMLDLNTLYEYDWLTPTVFDAAASPEDYDIYRTTDGLIDALTDSASEFAEQAANAQRILRRKVDGPLLVMGLLLVPMALAEAARKYRDYQTSVYLTERILQMSRQEGRLSPLSALIEVPYLRVLLAQVLLEKGEWEYKSGTPADPIEYNTDGSLKHQGLAAGSTFELVIAVFDDVADYSGLVYDGAKAQKTQLESLLSQYTMNPIAAAHNTSEDPAPLWRKEAQDTFDTISHTIPISTILTGPAGRVGGTAARPYEHILDIDNSAQPVLETNPVIYSVLTSAMARLQQLDAGLNYLGYREDYVPPWRFQYLLPRARAFAEHAKAAQRDYINFLSNAENEEYQQLSMQQQVIAADANVQLESARVEVAQLQVVAAQESVELAQMTAQNAEEKVSDYATFNQNATNTATEVLMITGFTSLVSGAMSTAGAPAGVLSAAGNIVSQGMQNELAAEQRAMEQQNLSMAAAEAEQAAVVAQANLNVAVASLNVATLQKSVALLNQEFAVQNLLYLQNRTLNAEMWYRLANMIRSIGENYLHRAMELSFLAQRAYNFEDERRLKVIRFDYDQDPTSGLLAADYLLRDLDTLEFDQAVSQRMRQQHVRYVASLAREYPSALQELRETGSTIFSLTLEQLERRFPGLYNVRLGSVEVTVTALMDSTRFSLALTHLGMGQVRVTAAAAAELVTQPPVPGNGSSSPAGSPPPGSPPPGSPPPGSPPPGSPPPGSPPPGGGTSANGGTGQNNQSWVYPLNPDVDQAWPVIFQTTGPQTALYSGLGRAELDASFSFNVSNQRGAFEGLGAASAWHLDMSLTENQIEPSTLADVLVSFTVSGYYDPLLKAAMDGLATQQQVLSRWISWQRAFPDGLFNLQQSGKSTVRISRELLTAGKPVGALRNVGVALFPTSNRPQFGSLTCTHVVQCEVTSELDLVVRSEIPQVHLDNELHSLTVSAYVEGISGATVTWDFGDDTTPVSGTGEGTPIEHTYARPGSYSITLRVVKSGRLYDFTIQVVVSASFKVGLPLTVWPILTQGTTSEGRLQVQLGAASPIEEEAYQCLWQISGQEMLRGSPVAYELPPGQYTLLFTATRDVKAYVYCNQRYTRDTEGTLLTLENLQVMTNREFDSNGNPVTVEENALTEQLFAEGPISPADRWTLELPIDDDTNTFLRTVSPADDLSAALADIDDVMFRLEYET